MLNRDSLYKKVGVRRVNDILAPKLLLGEEFVFPKNSVLFNWIQSDVLEYIDHDAGILVNSKKPQAKSVLEYIDTGLLGKAKPVSTSHSSVISALKKHDRSIKHLSPGKKSVTVPASTLFMFNYSALGSMYKYQPNPLNTYYKWHNGFSTAIHHLSNAYSGIGRHKYLSIHLPNTLPSFNLLKNMLGPVSRSTTNYLTTPKAYNVLEILRFLSPDHQKDSVLYNTLTKDEWGYIDILFMYNGNVVMFNLKKLGGLLDTNEVDAKIKTFKTDTVIKLMYIFFSTIKDSTPLTMRNIDNPVERSVDLSELIDEGVNAEEDTNEVDLDNIIDNEIGAGMDAGDISTVNEAAVVDGVADKEELATNSVDDSHIYHTTDTDVKHGLLSTIGNLKEAKLITKNTTDKLTKLLLEQHTKPSPYPGDKSTIGDLTTYAPDELDVPEEDIQLATDVTVFDKTMTRNTLGATNKKYISTTLKKDVMSTLYAVQNNGVLVEEHEVSTEESILGSTETHKLKLVTITGGTTTISVKLPVIQPNGSFKLSGNTYKMRKQRSDLPIRKVAAGKVVLSSYFSKVFVTKATYKRDDYGFWLQKKLLLQYEEDDKLTAIVVVNVTNHDCDVPSDYGKISRYIKGFKYETTVYHFEYSTRGKLLPDLDLSTIEKDGLVLVGHRGKHPVVMRDDNEVYLIKDKERIGLGRVVEILGIDESKAPLEYANLRVYKNQIPVVVLLGYYLGFNTLLKALKTNFRTVPKGTRVKLEDNEYVAKFQDVSYVFTKDNGINDMVFGALPRLESSLKVVPIGAVNKKSSYSVLFSSMELPMLYSNEIKLMGDMFVDPITKQVLDLAKLPTTFTGIILKACEMLLDDNYTHPNSLDGMMLKGYERVSGMLYGELVKSLRTNTNKSHFSKSKIEFNPYSVLSKIGEDSTVVLVDDLNPLAELKQDEDISYLGHGGRSEATMSAATRPIHVSEIGVISEGTKDSGAVGISAYLSANPKLGNSRGSKGTYDIKKDGWASTISTSAMLAPFGIKDDVKRLNFTNIMNGHTIPMKQMRPPYVRTGYESVITERVDDKYAITAEHPGKVLSVSDKAVKVEYKPADKKVKPYRESYTIKEWTTKEESGTAYTHGMAANVRKGKVFKKGDTLVYNTSFFEPDMFNSDRVMYRQGDYLTIALMEDPQTYEDSSTISTEVFKRMGTTVTKIKSVKVKATDNIYKPVTPGDKVEPKDPLFNITDASVQLTDDMDARTIEILKHIKSMTPKAGYRGKVSKVVVMYHAELSEMSYSIRKLVKESDTNLLADTGFTGKVDGGYSIQGTSLLPGEVEIKIYMLIEESMGIGDKAIFSNQLKTTIGEVFNYEATAKDGTVIEGMFSTRSIKARITNSPDLIGVTSMLLEQVGQKACELYFD